MKIEDARELLKTALDCPWCKIKPKLRTERVGPRTEPHRLVYLECPTCRVCKSVYMKDSDEDKANKLEYSYEVAVSIVCLDRVLKIWNNRV